MICIEAVKSGEVRQLEKREEGKENEDKVGDFRGEIFLRPACLTSAYGYYCPQVREFLIGVVGTG